MYLTLGTFKGEAQAKSYNDLCKSFPGIDWSANRGSIAPAFPDKLLFRDKPDTAVYLDMINYQCDKCTNIHVDITFIDLDNLTDRSILIVHTINELIMICSVPEYFNKTTFFKEGVEYDKNLVFQKLIFNQYWDKYLQ